MKSTTLLSFLLSLGLLWTACQPTAQTSQEQEMMSDSTAVPQEISLTSGFSMVKIADSIGRSRHIVVRQNGDIYINMARLTEDGHGIVALRDTDGDGIMDLKEGFGDYRGTGIDIHDGYLYASSDTVVYRYRLVLDQLLPELTAEKIIGGFLEQGQHASKTFAFDQEGHIYVNIGAPSNACQEEMRSPGSPGQDPCPQLEWQSGIWRFAAGTSGQSLKKDGMRYASGIRNAVAIAWDGASNSLYAAQHGRDDLHRLWPDLYEQKDNTELPSEELLQIDAGDDFGWPYCYFDHFQGKKLLAPEYGGDTKKTERCDNAKYPVATFPGHWGPNDLIFYTGDQFPERYRNGAFIAFHGSWNRAPDTQAGYNVVFVPFKDGKVSGDYEIFAEGFPGIESFQNPGDAQYRPCGLAVGPDGSLYISDSRQGAIWKVSFTKG